MSDPPEPEARTAQSERRVRLGEDRGPSVAERISDRLNELRYGSPIHRMRLKGRFPLKLLGVPADPVTGDANRGERLKAGRLWFDGHGIAIADGPLDDPEAPPGWRQHVHGWAWLRDVAADPPATEAEARRIETLARRWLERFPDYDPVAWAPELTARRILLAIAHAPLVIPRHDHVHRSLVLNGVARWTRHLDRVVRGMADGPARVEAILGLIGGCLMVPGHEPQRERAEALAAAALPALLSANGGMISRCPLDLAILGERLLFLSRFYAVRSLPPLPAIAEALGAARNGLSLLAMGGGLPAPWHGGQPSPAQMAALGVAPAPAPGGVAGFQRLVAGQTVLVVDAAPPPVERVSASPHASTLAFTLSDGPADIIVACGGGFAAGADGRRPLPLPDDLRTGLRTTAAHSTLVLADTNSTRLRLDGPRRAGGVEEVQLDSHGGAEGQWLECRHDGYRRRFGFDHVRRLWLAPDGGDLRGEDVLLPVSHGFRRLTAADPLTARLRFHLVPGATVSLTSDGEGALIRLPAARPRDQLAWGFRAGLPARAALALEPSLVVGHDGTLMPCQQLVVTAEAPPGQPLNLSWAFRRQGRG